MIESNYKEKYKSRVELEIDCENLVISKISEEQLIVNDERLTESNCIWNINQGIISRGNLRGIRRSKH